MPTLEESLRANDATAKLAMSVINRLEDLIALADARLAELGDLPKHPVRKKLRAEIRRRELANGTT